jgi:hypothetical protein
MSAFSFSDFRCPFGYPSSLLAQQLLPKTNVQPFAAQNRHPTNNATAIFHNIDGFCGAGGMRRRSPTPGK